MRKVFFRLAALVPAAAGVLFVGACSDPFSGRFDPLVTTDTISVTAPDRATVPTPSAIDITALGGFIGGGRRPELVSDAPSPQSPQGRWDIAVAIRDEALVFLPAGALGITSRAGLTRPLEGRTFDDLDEVPSGAQFVTDSAVAVQVGQVYVARSREVSTGFAGGCVQYARLEPLAADPATGIVTVQIATNERCWDTRLVNTGS